MGGPPNDPPISPKCQICKNNDLSCCKNGLYEAIRPPLDLVMFIHVLISVKVISTVDDVLISTVGWKSKLGFVSLKSYIKKRPPSLYPIGKFCTLRSGHLNKEIFAEILGSSLWMFLSMIGNFILHGIWNNFLGYHIFFGR